MRGKTEEASVKQYNNMEEIIRGNLIREKLPALAPEFDLRKIPFVYTADELRTALEGCADKELILLADSLLSMNNELMSGVGNVLVSALAKRIKENDCIYAINFLSLSKPYPYIRLTKEAVAFLDEDEAVRFTEEFNKNNTDKIGYERIENKDFPDYYTRLTRFGFEFLAIEPTLCKIRYKQNQLIGSFFDSTAGANTSYILLRFCQSMGANGKLKAMEKSIEIAMLAAIASSSFICLGVTIKNNFEALLINDKRDGSKWIPIFTDTAEIQETYTTIPAVAKTLISSEPVTLSFRELKRYLLLEKVSGVVINMGGCNLRLDRARCLKLMGIKK